MIQILSTRSLSEMYQRRIIDVGAEYQEYDAIEIEYLDFTWNSSFVNLIFTSQNAVEAFLKNPNSKDYQAIRYKCFCVGSKTKVLLERNNFHVVACSDNSKTLAENIVANYFSLSFLYFCGNMRREELPKLLKNSSIALKEIVVYKTHLNVLSFTSNFDIVLFYSPSGVESYTRLNNLENSIAFCIGSTTAKEAQKKGGEIKVAKKPTKENLIIELINYLKN
ncbi:uroporphyrinogen-III synthase [Eudoraea chungangensis]|uniref:uroporphyrinogen-III synthase n=1 Tax=Eudoraea chungangensis TaxID=1481905 RepID=UPI0023EDD4D4|nr:uroporphyrinogen-III synthase [Eudoraea chungangensis]